MTKGIALTIASLLLLSSCTTLPYLGFGRTDEAEHEYTPPVEDDALEAVPAPSEEITEEEDEAIPHDIYMLYDFEKYFYVDWPYFMGIREANKKPVPEEPVVATEEEKPPVKSADQYIELACCVLIFLTVVIAGHNAKRRAERRRYRE